MLPALLEQCPSLCSSLLTHHHPGSSHGRTPTLPSPGWVPGRSASTDSASPGFSLMCCSTDVTVSGATLIIRSENGWCRPGSSLPRVSSSSASSSVFSAESAASWSPSRHPRQCGSGLVTTSSWSMLVWTWCLVSSSSSSPSCSQSPAGLAPGSSTLTITTSAGAGLPASFPPGHTSCHQDCSWARPGGRNWENLKTKSYCFNSSLATSSLLTILELCESSHILITESSPMISSTTLNLKHWMSYLKRSLEK